MLSSCSDNSKNLVETKNDNEQGFKFGDNEESQDFYQQVNWDLAKVFRAENPCRKHLPQCCFAPGTRQGVKDIFLICLIPGFKIRDIDPYSPIIAQVFMDIIKTKFSPVVVETIVFTRWGNFSMDNKDNETFETQYFILRNQLYFRIENLRQTYKAQAHIHIIFVGESYGGKISLFFLDQLLENFDVPNVSFDGLITIHSPLHKMQMAAYALGSQFLHTTLAKSLSGFFDSLDFLNVANYKITFQILSSDAINRTSTFEALEHLQRSMPIFNFVGTLQEIHFGDTSITFNGLAQNCLENLQRLNRGLKFTLQSGIKDDDTLRSFLQDGDYRENSDFVVKTSEITKDIKLIEAIKRRRDVFGIYEAENMIFMSTPHLIHLGDIFYLERFTADVNSVGARDHFTRSLRRH